LIILLIFIKIHKPYAGKIIRALYFIFNAYAIITTENKKAFLLFFEKYRIENIIPANDSITGISERITVVESVIKGLNINNNKQE
jgi:hypothetical protein